MTYTKNNLPDEFTAINSSDTLITLKRVAYNEYILSSKNYPQEYQYTEGRIIHALNHGTWEIKKIILMKQLDYEIF